MSAPVSNSLLSARPLSLSPVVTPLGVAAGSEEEQSPENATDLVNLSRHDPWLPRNVDFLHQFSTPGKRIAPRPPTILACSQTSSGFTSSNGLSPPLDNRLGIASYAHSNSSASTVESAPPTDSEASTPRTVDSRVSTPSTQTSFDSTSCIHPQRQRQSPYPGARPYYPPRVDTNVSGAISPIVSVAAHNILRDDWLRFLQAELPRWTEKPLWNDARVLEQADGTSAFRELELVYSSVCQLDIRMSDDVIRNRMALIRLHLEYSKAYEQHHIDPHARTIGRGGASVIIDAILRSIHKDWEVFDDGRKSDLRVKFHNRKRYGKRWLLLTNALGLGILLVCSQKMANMV